MSRLSVSLTESVHAFVQVLPRFDYGFNRSDLPANGLYFFFERGETAVVDGRPVDRIVRVGTHRGDGRLPKRLRQHFSGNRRGSVFRYHVGGAHLTREDPNDGRFGTWVGDKGIRMPEIEHIVSRIMQERFIFSCIRVDDAAERLTLERGLIALLAQQPLGPPSDGWLGRHALHPAVRASGLWNTQHVGAAPIGPDAVTRLAGLVHQDRPDFGVLRQVL